MSKLILFFCLFFSLLLQAKISHNIKTHFTIAIDPEYIPFTQKDIDGKPTGLLVDFWNLWAEQNGYTVTYKFYPWEETLLATQRGDVDFHSGTTKDREWMFASMPIYSIKTAFFTLSSSADSNAKDFQHKRIGAIDKYYASLVKKVIGDTVQIIMFDDYEPLVEALKKGEIDGLIEDVEALQYYFIKTGQMNLFKMLKDEALQFDSNIYAITNKKNVSLLHQINAGIKKLSITKLANIEKVWLPNIENTYYNQKLKSTLFYSPKEISWLKKHNKVTLVGDPQWETYFTATSNNSYLYRGLIGDYIKMISKKTNLDIKMHPIQSWDEISLLTTDYPDILVGYMDNKTKNKLTKMYHFLPPFETGPLVVIMPKNVRFISSLYDIKNKKIGLLENQEYTQRIKSTYTGYQFCNTKTAKTLLNQLETEKIDAAILPLASAINFLATKKYSIFNIVEKINEKGFVSIGVIKEKPILQNILKKTLYFSRDSYKKEILSAWTHKLNYVETTDYTLTYMVSGLLGLLLASTGYYAYAMRRKHQHTKVLKKKLEILALTDDLTGLPNRRAFNQNCENLARNQDEVGLLFIDIDFFKPYNDYYGHLQGDETLKEIANCIQLFASDKAYPYRIGGEEFGLILYDNTMNGVIQYAKKIRQYIEDKNIEHKSSPLGYVTVSIGVSIRKMDDTRYALYQCADNALYVAKKLGRNKIFFSEC